MIRFAEMYPEKVSGIIFLDSSHPAQFEKLHMGDAFDKLTRFNVALVLSLLALGMTRFLKCVAPLQMRPELGQWLLTSPARLISPS
jgi:hypothetical protein